ncbi:MAG: methionine synthase [Prevotella sp.]|nr:methionine synthase [Prevotella sp.]
MTTTRDRIIQAMTKRILVLDGGIGTYLQKLQLKEEDFQGETFLHHHVPLKGCNDVLCISNPQVVIDMHRNYIKAGADIIETNSFNCNLFSLSDYGLEDKVYDIAKASAECADKSRKMETADSDREVFIAGSIGPTNRTSSMSADVNNPAAREVTFQQLVDTYTDAIKGLLDGGADIIIIETIFDTLNAKAALKALDDICRERQTDIPVMVSGTLSDASGRTLSGQTVEAYAASLSHANLLSIGLNCGFGAKQLKPWLSRLAAATDYPISMHPNAGLPNVMGGYDETPETFAAIAEEVFSEKLVNIYGGCCGTTPEHIKAVAEIAKKYQPREIKAKEQHACTLSGLEPLVLNSNTGFVNIGERTNVAGSAKFKRLIQAGNYEEALTVARAQVDAGAQVIDICMDDGLIDGVKAMTTFLNLIASEPEIARVPVMIDSSKWEILKAGLQCVQGKSIVNSISLKEGEEKFLQKASYIHAMGAATVVMLFDENGQADTYERKMEVARRAYRLLKGIGFPGEDIIFDPNVLAVATGMPEHDDYGRAFIEACRTIHQEMPEVHMSGGISNLSFSFRGNNTVRQAMHSVFLYHAINAGLDMSIVNPAMLTIYDDIPLDLRNHVEDVILNKDKDAAERLISFAQQIKEKEDAAKEANGGKPMAEEKAPEGLHERISHAMLKGIDANIEETTEEALTEAGTPLAVIDDYLMPAMEQVGKLFGEGKMFLPQVVKSARVMKKAVAVLEPYMKSGNTSSSASGKILMATVKGDVHDIGKNIVGVVILCNGYDVKDLGVMVEPQTIVEEAQKWGADVIGLSGLITPSLDEMIKVLRELERRGMTTPVLVGGATTSPLHTAVKMAPEYPHGIVIHAHAAADNPAIIRRLLADDSEEYKAELRQQQRIIRENYLRAETSKPECLSIEEARKRRHHKSVSEIAVPKSTEKLVVDVRFNKVKPFINWNLFLQAWQIKGETRKQEEGKRLLNDAKQLLNMMQKQKLLRLGIVARILPAYSNDDDEIIIQRDGQDFHLPMPRSLKDEAETHCLADYIARPLQALQISDCPCCQRPHRTDFICPFVVTAGIGIKELQDRFRSEGDEYHAIMVKLLADRLAEALAEYLSSELTSTLKWGSNNIRMAFGYGACPDHSLKQQVFDILDVKAHLPLSLTETYMIDPGESICGLIFANTPLKYFNV